MNSNSAGGVLGGARAGAGARGSRALARSSGSTSRHHLLVGLTQSGERGARIDLPAAGGVSRTLDGRNTGCLLLIAGKGNSSRVQGRPVGLEVGKVRRHWGWCALAGVAILDDGVGRSANRGAVADQPVIVGLLNPLIDNRTGPSAGHLRAKDRVLVVKGTRCGGVATRLGEENGNGVVRGILLQHVVSRNLVARLAAPLVGVQRVEVQALRFVLGACKVVLEHGAQVGDICSGIANGDVPVTLLITVGLDITGSSQNVGGGVGAIGHGQDFVADKDTGGVIKLLELIENFLETVELGLVPVRGFLYASVDD